VYFWANHRHANSHRPLCEDVPLSTMNSTNKTTDRIPPSQTAVRTLLDMSFLCVCVSVYVCVCVCLFVCLFVCIVFVSSVARTLAFDISFFSFRCISLSNSRTLISSRRSLPYGAHMFIHTFLSLSSRLSLVSLSLSRLSSLCVFKASLRCSHRLQTL
jgi:hypothetical protein